MATKTENQEVDENIDLQSIADGEEEIKQEELQEEVKFSEVEQKAHEQGWKPEEDYKGDPGEWKTAKEFITHGEYIDSMKSLHHKLDAQKKGFDERLENTNKLHNARLQSEIKSQKGIQRDAVGMSDKEAYDKAQDQIDELEKQQVTETTTTTDDSQQNPAITAWNAKNPWIKDPNDERGPVSLGIWNNYITKNPTATVDQALNHVDSRLNALYPVDNTNPRRLQPNITETNNNKPKRSNKELTMTDLTAGELQEWDQYGSMMFKTEKAFLKAVSDTRKAQ